VRESLGCSSRRRTSCTDGGVDASRFQHVSQHDFASLQFVISQSNFDELKQADLLLVLRVLASQQMIAEKVLQLVDEVFSLP
jgi:hypothetical protein